jgi:hypothetical protein
MLAPAPASSRPGNETLRPEQKACFRLVYDVRSRRGRTYLARLITSAAARRQDPDLAMTAIRGRGFYTAAMRTNPPKLLAHEALHWYLNEINSPLMGEEAHAWIATEEKRCAGTA